MTGATTMKMMVLYQPSGMITEDDCAEQSRHDDVLIDVLEADHAFADGFGDGGAEEEGREKVKGRRPEDGKFGGEHAGGDHGRDAVGGIVKSVEEVEGQSDEDCDQDQKDVFVQRGGLRRGFAVWDLGAGFMDRFVTNDLRG